MARQNKILIIEDDKSLIKALGIAFSVADFSVTTVSNGLEALDKIKRSKPDVILLDILMPKLNGFSFLEQIRQNEKIKDIPVIIFSNYGGDEYIKKGQQLGVIEYIEKTSITMSELTEKIKKYFNEKSDKKNS